MRARGATALAFAVLLSPAFATAAEKGTVTFVVRDDRGNDVDAKVTLDTDGTPVPLGLAQTLEPGIHDVHWSIASGASGHRKLTVIEGQHGRIFQIVASVPPPVVSPVVASEAPAASASNASNARSPWPYISSAEARCSPSRARSSSSSRSTKTTDANHYFWTSTREDLSSAERDAFRDSGRSHYDAAQTNEAIAITSGIIAVTAVIVAVTWLILGNM